MSFQGSITTADGSALVRLGDTTIVCGVKAEIAEPDIGLPNSGFIGEYPTHRYFPIDLDDTTIGDAVPNFDLSAMCSPRFKTGPPGEEAQIVSQYIYDTLLR